MVIFTMPARRMPPDAENARQMGKQCTTSGARAGANQSRCSEENTRRYRHLRETASEEENNVYKSLSADGTRRSPPPAIDCDVQDGSWTDRRRSPASRPSTRRHSSCRLARFTRVFVSRLTQCASSRRNEGKSPGDSDAAHIYDGNKERRNRCRAAMR